VPDRKTIVQVKFRMRKDLLGKITKAAKTADRSVNEEIEERLEQSFTGDPLINALHRGEDTARTLRMIEMAMRLESAGEDGTIWSENQSKAEAVHTAVNLIIAAIANLESPALIRPTDATVQLRPAERGRLLAQFVLEKGGMKLPRERDANKMTQ
jgi:hypothetical protein